MSNLKQTCDFSGWATRNDLLCGDGRVIRKDAFKDCDGSIVPLMWNHNYDVPGTVLGHALLENRNGGVYAYGKFNNTESGENAKELLHNGDIRSLSIFANRLVHEDNNVVHGVIREVSLVLAGSNPGAYVDYVAQHSDDGDDAVYACWDENAILVHSDINMKGDDGMANEVMNPEEVFNSMTEDQQNLVYAMVEAAMTGEYDDDENDDGDDISINDGGDGTMRHNIFDQSDNNRGDSLTHDEMSTIIRDSKRLGSMRESFLSHSAEYGIDNIEYLFPEARNLNNPPEFIKRDNDWVSVVMNSVHKTPFSKVKSTYADITEDQARAKGYIKGKLKKEEVFSLLKRTTGPTTVYKKQKMDRDDIIDITDFDVVAWLKTEMREMLNEEIARAILIGDGRLASDDDKIDENCIRPIVNDADLFTIRWSVAAGSTADDKAKNFIRAAIKARKNYRGSGNPILYTTEDMLTDMLLLEDTQGYRIYKSETELATALRVSKIVTVPVMENFKDKDSKDVYGIIVNTSDYNIGADKGGAINMFDDFDIDYNQQKYLIETRCSGALIKPFSAIVLRSGTNTESEEPGLAAAKAALNA